MNPIFPELKDKTILLTGGANGIGAATVETLIQQGANIFMADRDARAASNLLENFRERGLKEPHFTELDLSDVASAQKWVQNAGDTAGEIHGVVNNAAVDPRITLEELKVEDWDQLFQINVRSYNFIIQSALPYIPESGASIVNFASITFHTAPRLLTTYVATKGAVLALTRALARELGARKIRVNTLSPGWIMTDRQLRDYVDEEVKELIFRSQCVPELIQPEEIARVVLFLLSDMSAAVTGQELLADRGWAHS